MYVVHVIMHAFECLKVHSHMWEFFFPNTIHIDIQSSPPPCFFILVFACLLKICKYEYYNIMFNTSINSSYCLCYIFFIISQRNSMHRYPLQFLFGSYKLINYTTYGR